MRADTDDRRLDKFSSTAIATNAKKDAVVEAESGLEEETPARTRSESTSEENYKGR